MKNLQSWKKQVKKGDRENSHCGALDPSRLHSGAQITFRTIIETWFSTTLSAMEITQVARTALVMAQTEWSWVGHAGGCPLSAENRNFRQNYWEAAHWVRRKNVWSWVGQPSWILDRIRQNFMKNVGGGGKKKSQKGGSRQSPSPDWVVMSGPCWRLPTECGEP